MFTALPRLLKIGAAILIIAVLVRLLYDPISSLDHHRTVANIQTELPQAQAKWDAARAKDYRFEISGDALGICKPSAIVEVRDGEVVDVEVTQITDAGATFRALPMYQWADPDWGDEVFLCDYGNFTVTRLFDFLHRTLRDSPLTIMDAEFDSTYGFVTHMKYGLYVGYGLLRPNIGECCSEFTIRRFAVLSK